MPAFDANQWAILFLVLLLGWLLGLVSRSGGAKWRRAYESERDARVEERREHDAALTAANARVAELQARTRAPAVVSPAAATSVQDPDVSRDDLGRIRGIGSAGARRLNAEGIYRYRDIVDLSPSDEAALEQRMGADPGYIEQEQWREQAAMLDRGDSEGHSARFG